jgi:hypothetical protein
MAVPIIFAEPFLLGRSSTGPDFSGFAKSKRETAPNAKAPVTPSQSRDAADEKPIAAAIATIVIQDLGPSRLVKARPSHLFDDRPNRLVNTRWSWTAIFPPNDQRTAT